MNTFSQAIYVIGRSDVNCVLNLKTTELYVVIPSFKIKCTFITHIIIPALSPQIRQFIPSNIKHKPDTQMIH